MQPKPKPNSNLNLKTKLEPSKQPFKVCPKVRIGQIVLTFQKCPHTQGLKLKDRCTHIHSCVPIFSKDITLIYIHFLETYPYHNYNHYLPNRVFALKCNDLQYGDLCFCPQKEGESPQCDTQTHTLERHTHWDRQVQTHTQRFLNSH